MKTNRYIFFKLNFRISCHLINLDVVEDRLMKFCRNLYIGLDFFQMTNLFELLIFSLNFDLRKKGTQIAKIYSQRFVISMFYY